MHKIRPFVLFAFLSILSCKDEGIKPPVEDGPPLPPQPRGKLGCPFEHVEVDDTARSYVFWTGDTLTINISYVFTRFAKGTPDSVAVSIGAKYGLALRVHVAGDYVFCVPTGKRAEEFFTPYGKPTIQSFGNESLVEVAYAIFENGLDGKLDDFFVRFDSTTTRASIDSINSLYDVVVDKTLLIADQVWYKLKVTKTSPYSSFDMANLYHCLKEVIDSTAHTNVYAFNPPMGEKCEP